MPLTTLTIDDLYNEVADLARDQGIKNKAGWTDLAETIIEDHMEMGEIDLDEDSEGMKEELRGRWLKFKATPSNDEEEEGGEEKAGEKDGAVEDKEDEYDEEDEEDDMEDEEDDDLRLDYGDGDEE